MSAGACSPSKAPSRSALQIESAIVTAHSRASLLRGEGAGTTGGGLATGDWRRRSWASVMGLGSRDWAAHGWRAAAAVFGEGSPSLFWRLHLQTSFSNLLILGFQNATVGEV